MIKSGIRSTRDHKRGTLQLTASGSKVRKVGSQARSNPSQSSRRPADCRCRPVDKQEPSQIIYILYYGYRIRLTTIYVSTSRGETLKANANADLERRRDSTTYLFDISVLQDDAFDASGLREVLDQGTPIKSQFFVANMTSLPRV